MTAPTADLIAHMRANLTPDQTDDRQVTVPAEDLARLVDRLDELSTFVDAIPADRRNPWHTVTVHATGWHMAHPLDCDLVACPFDARAQAEWDRPPHAEGVWRWHNFGDEPAGWEADGSTP